MSNVEEERAVQTRTMKVFSARSFSDRLEGLLPKKMQKEREPDIQMIPEHLYIRSLAKIESDRATLRGKLTMLLLCIFPTIAFLVVNEFYLFQAEDEQLDDMKLIYRRLKKQNEILARGGEVEQKMTGTYNYVPKNQRGDFEVREKTSESEKS